MWYFILLFLAGLALLIKGADLVSDHGSKLAKSWGVSELVIGITLVAVATSLPELAVSVISAITESASIATGTIIGSNISNIGLIIGISALIFPLATKREFLRQEYAMIAFCVIGALFLLDGMFWYEGAILIAMLLVYMYLLIRQKKPKTPNIIEEFMAFFRERMLRRKRRPWAHLLVAIAGGVVVVIGAEVLIFSTLRISEMIGISELVISLIAIAIGTSLPELAVSFTAAFKGMRGISIGNIIGSNIFNISILGIASVFSVVPVTQTIVQISLPIMIILSLLLLVFMKTKWEISRKEGVVLLLVYAAFIYLLFV